MSEESDDETSATSAIGTLLGGAGWVFGGRVAKLVLLFVVEILMARILGTASYGGVVLATMVLSLGTMFGSVGMDAGLSRNIPHYEDDPRKARGVLRAGLGYSLVASLTIAAAVFAFAPQLASYVFEDPELAPLFRITAVGIPFSVFAGKGIAIAKGSRDAKTHVAIKQVLRPTSEFVLIGVFVVGGYEAVGAMAGKVIAAGLAAAGAIYLGYRYVRFDVRGPTTTKYREMIAFSLPLVFASGMSFLISNTDTFLIGTFLPSGDVGVYNAAFQLKQLGAVFFFPAVFLVTPVFTRLNKQAGLDEARRTYQIVTKWTTFVSLPLVVLLLFFPDVVISVTFGADYTSAATALQLLTVPIFVTIVMGANAKALIALGHTNVQLYVNGGMAVLNVALNVVLIPAFGITGAAVASMIALSGRDVLYTLALYRWHGIQPFSKPLLKPLAVVAVLAPAAYFAFVVLFPVRFLTVAALGLVALVPYALLITVFGGFESDDAEIAAAIEEKAGIDLARLRSIVHRLTDRQ